MKVTSKVISAFLFTTLFATLLFTTTIPVNAHYPGAVIQSNWTTTIPAIDGVISPGEWADSTMIDLQASDPANEIEAYVYFKNDGDYLYTLVDVAGDTTEGGDESTLSFDTGNDATYTDGHEDTFSWHFTEFDHRVWNSTASDHVLCCHFNPTLPLHTGLDVDRGFGSSPKSGINHVMYEYQIPLSLILASPGDTIGFAMDGELGEFLGIYDESTGRGDQWPFLRWDTIELYEYGDLILATDAESSADFSATPTTGATPLEVQFTEDYICDFSSWNWDFGDGNTSNEQNPVHIYTHPGPFTVSLIASGGSCQNITSTKVDYIHPYTIGVGGEAYPVNNTGTILPWVILGLSGIAGSIILFRRRTAKNYYLN